MLSLRLRLHHILRTGLDALDEAGLTEMLTFANAGASIITTRRGALKVMPTPEEIAALCAAGKDTQ